MNHLSADQPGPKGRPSMSKLILPSGGLHQFFSLPALQSMDCIFICSLPKLLKMNKWLILEQVAIN